MHDTQKALRDERHFELALHGSDPEASVPAADLLTGLRGKDVIIDFIESYGQVAVHRTKFSRGVDAVLRQSTASLARAGWSTRSAWLGSPTYGGISWLAHSTLQSGLWVDTEQRYAELTSSSRYTLSDAFKKAGWRTVSDVPSDDYSWPPGTSFYHFDKLYNRLNVGYHGPTFSFASMPDQYTYAALQRREFTPGHKPLMVEIDTVSSHTPWAPLPTMVPWNKVGNGSIFDAMPARSESPITVWRNASTVQQFYGQSIQYSMRALTSWVTELNDPNLVLVLLGDHQPSSTVSGDRVQPPGADLDRRPRPVRVQEDCSLALAGRADSGAHRSARAYGRLPQPVPQHLQHGLRPRRRHGPVSQGRWLVSLTRWTAANPRPCHWISLMQAEPRYSR